MLPHICFHRVSLLLLRYNKRDFDFPSLREYNDYLERVEDVGRTNSEASLKEMAEGMPISVMLTHLDPPLSLSMDASSE